MTPERFSRMLAEFFGDAAAFLDKGGAQWEVRVPRDRCLPMLSFCRDHSFVHLALVSAVDWIREDEIELVYHLWSYEHRVHLLVKTRLDRKKPWMFTAHRLWGHAQAYEQEIHEMMGVHFVGNPDLSPLFLHNWKDKPPLRKDFDPRAYSLAAYTLEGLGLMPPAPEKAEKEDGNVPS
jgi:NADH-quinone oxidoreductase subunit C